MNDNLQTWMEIKTAERFTPRSLLLVDDSTQDCDIIMRRSRDFNVLWTMAFTAESALREITDKVCKFEIIFLDLNLSESGDGIKLFAEIKKVCPNIPVIVFSGFIDTRVIAEIYRIGFALFLPKPEGFDQSFFDQLFLALDIPKKEAVKKMEVT